VQGHLALLKYFRGVHVAVEAEGSFENFDGHGRIPVFEARIWSY
jgi:hypothetical protein